MELDKFFQQAVHLDNFNSEQLDDLLDFKGIDELEEHPWTADALRLLGQFLVGNKQETARDITVNYRNKADEFCRTWVEVIADNDTIRNIAIYFASMI